MNAKETLKDLALPFKILFRPLSGFSQLAQKPSWIGLLPLSALVLLATAATLYTRAADIDLNINGQQTSFIATDAFSGWFLSFLISLLISIIIYWIVFASGLALVSRSLSGKQTSWRVQVLGLVYLLSVFVVTYAVRAVAYLALPKLYFEQLSFWPPVEEAQINSALNVILQGWGPLYPYFEFILPIVAFAWLVLLGAAAVKVLREVSWIKALIVSVIGFSITLILFGLPP